MKTLLTIFLCLFAANAYAAPFVVSDPYTTGTIPDGFLVSVDGGAVVESAAVANAMRFDVGTAEAGQHTVTIRAYKDTTEWGRMTSDPVNFTLTRPAAPVGPSGIRLAP